jgi:hydrogenase maturation protease
MNPPPRTARVRVVGIGSPFGADGVGWRAAELVGEQAARQPWHRDVDVVERARVTDVPLLAQMADLLIVIDAMRARAAPGTVQCIGVDALSEVRALSCHGVGLAEAFALARALGESPREIEIYGIEIGAPEIAARATQTLERAAQSVARQVIRRIEFIFTNTSSI